MADHLHEVMTGAQQDRSRVRTSSVAAAIQSLKFVSRKAQVDPLITILDTPLIAEYLAGAASPRLRREALPLPLAVLVQWERWICSGSAPEHENFFIGSILLMAWAGLHFADAQRTCSFSLLPDRHECWRTKVSRSGQPFGALAFGFSGRPPSWSWGRVYFNSLRNWHSQMVNHKVRIWSSTALSHTWCSTCPVAVANPTRFSTATKFLRRALQAPQMHNAQMSPEQAWQYTLLSLKATMHSIAKQVDVPERQHGGRASVRLKSRDDLWGAPACQQLVVQRVAEGFLRDAERRFPKPSLQSRLIRSPS